MTDGDKAWAAGFFEAAATFFLPERLHGGRSVQITINRSYAKGMESLARFHELTGRCGSLGKRAEGYRWRCQDTLRSLALLDLLYPCFSSPYQEVIDGIRRDALGTL